MITVTNLDIRENSSDDEGVIQLLQKLRNNSALTCIDLSGDGLTKAAGGPVAELLFTNSCTSIPRDGSLPAP